MVFGVIILSLIILQYMSSDFLNIKLLSFQTRIDDLRFLLTNFSFYDYKTWFGEGIGVRSEVVRYSPFTVGIVESRSFLEIDNGFYYVFHRFGLFGLSAIFFVFLYTILFSKGSMRILSVFLCVTMTLSITVITSTSVFVALIWVYYETKNKLLYCSKNN